MSSMYNTVLSSDFGSDPKHAASCTQLYSVCAMGSVSAANLPCASCARCCRAKKGDQYDFSRAVLGFEGGGIWSLGLSNGGRPVIVSTGPS